MIKNKTQKFWSVPMVKLSYKAKAHKGIHMEYDTCNCLTTTRIFILVHSSSVTVRRMASTTTSVQFLHDLHSIEKREKYCHTTIGSSLKMLYSQITICWETSLQSLGLWVISNCRNVDKMHISRFPISEKNQIQIRSYRDS